MAIIRPTPIPRPTVKKKSENETSVIFSSIIFLILPRYRAMIHHLPLQIELRVNQYYMTRASACLKTTFATFSQKIIYLEMPLFRFFLHDLVNFWNE